MSMLACKKESSDEQPPVVTITAPMEGLSIFMPDTIAVAASAEDNEQLDILNFGLVDENLNWVGERIYVSNPSNPASFNLALPVTDLDIASGTHYLEVLAGDGENDKRSFVEVNVIGIPRVFLGVTYHYEQGSTSSVAFQNTSSTAIEIASDEELFYAADGRQSSVYVFSESDRALRAYDLQTGEVKWSVSDAVPSGETVVELIYDPITRKVFILSDAPRIFSFGHQGAVFGSFEINSNYDVKALIADADDLWLLSSSSSGERLSRLFKSSGFEIENYSLNYTAVRMASITEDELILIDDEGDVHIVEVLSDDQYMIPVAGNGLVHSILTVAGTAYFASESSVFRYTAGGSQVPAVHSGTAISGMTYDEVGQRMILAEGGELRFYDLNTWQQVGTLPAEDAASDLHALFNK
jgi:outer membrane protein assembly factor BamB